MRNVKGLKNLLEKIKNNELEPIRNARRWIKEHKLTWKEHIKKLVKIYKSILRMK